MSFSNGSVIKICNLLNVCEAVTVFLMEIPRLSVLFRSVAFYASYCSAVFIK